jgi:hypothetical protein
MEATSLREVQMQLLNDCFAPRPVVKGKLQLAWKRTSDELAGDCQLGVENGHCSIPVQSTRSHGNRTWNE